jgi:hypothetical protein
LSQKLQNICPKEHLAGWGSAQRAAHAAFEEELVDLRVGLSHWKISLKILIDWNLQTDYSLKCYFYRRDFISVYTPNFTWVKAHYYLSTEMLADKKLVKKYVVDHRDLFLYQK